MEIRAREVNERLWRVLNRTTLAKQPPTVSIATLNNRPILEIKDDKSSRPIRLVTVTEPDADFNGKTLDELAQEWQKIVQDEVVRFRELAAPEAIMQRVQRKDKVTLSTVYFNNSLVAFSLQISRPLSLS